MFIWPDSIPDGAIWVMLALFPFWLLLGPLPAVLQAAIVLAGESVWLWVTRHRVAACWRVWGALLLYALLVTGTNLMLVFLIDP